MNSTKEFDLANEIKTVESTFRVTGTKIEIKLKKTSDIRWNNLEGQQSESFSTAYPSSNKQPRDWDKLEKEAMEIEDETDPLDKLFKSIYKDASDETRRAMNKSFVESQGTVLSTNWDEVGKGKVEMRPPDGMEFKKYSI